MLLYTSSPSIFNTLLLLSLRFVYLHSFSLYHTTYKCLQPRKLLTSAVEQIKPHKMKTKIKKDASHFDCFRPVNSTITYLIGLNLFFILPLLAFIPHHLPIYEFETVVWLAENYGHILRNVFAILILFHLLEVG